ncbi:SDR family oxidoreductase [Nocardioides jishulii]|uniref:SDR family oxidoreductase n=1 Tax=Nocardioides jishulii TaxID=2575440 RepID=A0A4U2YUK9_9ACTN|nr:SDR family oxidoreductase [Nocardioides jishulii]QCX28343.1 SDR family oxidoreductase [Nocardioides jishulii]TKI64764.1 SDR family oxidoreductase [Nocardioides jishulii]
MSLTVLVTGGSGFLGTSVVRGLARRGHAVLSADLRHRGEAPAGVEQLTMDVTDADAVEAAFAHHDVDVVVHLASIVTPGQDSDVDLEYAVDVTGTRHVLDACLRHGVRRVVVSSSGAAYGYHPDNGAAHGGWLTEDDPVRGNHEFVYSRHKRLVEEMLAELRTTHPELEQVVLRIGTILGESVDNQITALFEKQRLLKIRGAESPFVFIWDTDVVGAIERAVTGEVTGIFNVAGDGALTIDEIAARLGRGTIAVPEPLMKVVLGVGRRLGVSRYGPEQTVFLAHRPVLDNTRLRTVLGYVPEKSSAEAFDAWRVARGL